jgi:SAM-dependent methyltransferase
MEHSDRVAQEIDFFRDMDLNALPEIYSYWSNKHLIAFLFEAFASHNLFDIFAQELGASVMASRNSTIVSIGAGDAEVDQLIATHMLELGFTDFRFECLELSGFLIDRAQARLAGTPVAGHFTFTEADLSTWKPERQFGACFAHQSLHHIVALEHVFDQIRDNLAPGGSFLTSDIIGRNGHLRWPETLAIVNAIWAVAPDRWKHNRPLARFEKEFINWDCSTHGFEGVRAQDILPLLVERFHFHKLAAWGGILDPFIERAFGHNLSSENDVDRTFVDTVWASNRTLVRLGVIKPTQFVAVMKNEPGPLISADGLDPAACVRRPDAP